MKNSLFAKSVMIAAVLPLLAGCVVYERQPVAVAPPPGQEVVVESPGEPPPPQVEVVPVAPDPAFIWIGGNWEWRGRWVWVGGRWAPRPHPGAVWIRGEWARHGHGRVWVEGHWR